MSKKNVSQVRQYTSVQPGYSISLPENIVYIDPKINRRRGRVLFTSVKGGKRLTDEGVEEIVVGGIFKTDNPAIQEFIENHPAFKQGILSRVPTPEEIAEKEHQRAIDQKIQFYKELPGKGVPVDLGAMKDSNLRVVAKEIGIETVDDEGKKLSKDELVEKVREVLSLEK